MGSGPINNSDFSSMIRTLFILALLLPAWLPQRAAAQDPALRFGGQIPPEVDRIYERGLEWLAKKQAEDGAWQDGQSGSGVLGS